MGWSSKHKRQQAMMKGGEWGEGEEREKEKERKRVKEREKERKSGGTVGKERGVVRCGWL